MMQSVKEAWKVLNVGGTISNGEIEVTYVGGELVCTPECLIIPFDMDNIEEWEEVVEVGQLYCRWYLEDEDGILISNAFNRIEDEPLEGWTKMNEAFTREEILGL
jgi:hypothetical protein